MKLTYLIRLKKHNCTNLLLQHNCFFLKLDNCNGVKLFLKLGVHTRLQSKSSFPNLVLLSRNTIGVHFEKLSVFVFLITFL